MLELFKQLGVSRSDILAYEAMMDERAKYRVPNGKFRNVNEALLLVKHIAEFCEGKIRVEYIRVSFEIKNVFDM